MKKKIITWIGIILVIFGIACSTGAFMIALKKDSTIYQTHAAPLEATLQKGTYQWINYPINNAENYQGIYAIKFESNRKEYNTMYIEYENNLVYIWYKTKDSAEYEQIFYSSWNEESSEWEKEAYKTFIINEEQAIDTKLINFIENNTQKKEEIYIEEGYYWLKTTDLIKADPQTISLQTTTDGNLAEYVSAINVKTKEITRSALYGIKINEFNASTILQEQTIITGYTDTTWTEKPLIDNIRIKDTTQDWGINMIHIYPLIYLKEIKNETIANAITPYITNTKEDPIYWINNFYLNYRSGDYYENNKDILNINNPYRLIYFNHALSEGNNVISIDFTAKNTWEINIDYYTNERTFTKTFKNKDNKETVIYYYGDEEHKLNYPIYLNATIMPKSLYIDLTDIFQITTTTGKIEEINPEINQYLENIMNLQIWGIGVETFFGIGIGAIMLSLILKFFAGG